MNPLRYRSYYYDSETGYYHLKSRYYSPEVGRFLNADSVLDSRSTNALNLFVYCGNNPVNNQDPDGQFFFGALIGGIVGGATGALAAAVKGKSIKAGLLTGAVTGGQQLCNRKLTATLAFRDIFRSAKYISDIQTADLRSLTRIKPKYPQITLTLSWTFNSFKAKSTQAKEDRSEMFEGIKH